MSYVVSASAVRTGRVVQCFDVARCLAPFSPVTGLEASPYRGLPTAQAGVFWGVSR
jgi:hypothetical protein